MDDAEDVFSEHQNTEAMIQINQKSVTNKEASTRNETNASLVVPTSSSLNDTKLKDRILVTVPEKNSSDSNSSSAVDSNKEMVKVIFF